MKGTEKAEQVREKRSKAFFGKAGVVGINSLGFLSALGIAFGGLFLVRNRLAQEESQLLRGEGSVEIQVQTEVLQAQDVGAREAEQKLLTERQLCQVVEKLEREMGAYPHEPWEGQLSLGEAAVCGREWMEEFLLPHMGVDNYRLTEYSVDCYLWAWQSDVEAGEMDPVFSYWNVWITTGDLTASMTLNAVTGQVLSAAVSSTLLVEYQEEGKIQELLHAYGDSFGLEREYVMYSEDKGEQRLALSESIGVLGLHAAVKTSNVVVATADSEYPYSGFVDLFTIDLRLGTD